MTFKFVFDPIASTEYVEAYNWYKDKSEVAGDGLIIEVEETIRAICDNPLRYKNTFRNLREVSLKKYPYTIVYMVHQTANMVAITSIYHHSRNPKKKYRKS